MDSSKSPDQGPQSYHDTDDIKIAWENFVVKKLPPGREIRPEVLSSWQRCREIGLDPYSSNLPPVLSQDRLKVLMKHNKDLIELSKPVMQMVGISVRDSGFIFTLADKNGYVLMVSGDEDILEMAERNYYSPGSLRSIEHAGTNAIGLCLIEGKPIQITGPEHYKLYHHPWTCSSAPIRDPNGNIIGAITLSGRSVGSHRHTLALVTAAAETIESQLRERVLIDDKLRLNSMLSFIYDSISDGIIAIGCDLEITHINSIAAKMLDLDSGTIVGARFDEIIQADNSLTHSLETRNYFTGQETLFHCPNGDKTYICRADPIRNNRGHLLGTIITMSEKLHVINLAKKFSGNYSKYNFNKIKGKSPGFIRQIELARVAARTNSRILIIGESGTGKELFAQAIHSESNRRNEPFVAISCTAIPRDLIEAELFGYRGGAFTGARREGQVGKFELANHGTLFLDEINGMPLDLQTKLLRVLQQNEIMRLGDTRCIPVDVRVIAASSTDLLSEVENANFREDLYYRLNVVEIFIPPLRERIADLELLIDHIMEQQCQEMGVKRPALSEAALDILRKYHWPGNVRELENYIERALLLSEGKTIRAIHLPDKPLRRSGTAEHGTMPVPIHQGYRDMIEAALKQCNGNASMAARELQIARSTLYRKMKEYGFK
jgi:transcriptional regulator of acetoin/glycerol metabolism